MNEIVIMSTVLAYFGLLLLISKFTGKRADNDAFFRGNRCSPWYVVAFGMIGASLSGVTFVSVPGMVRPLGMTYLQTCIGFFFGYLVVAFVLLPLYYKLNLTSIYSYLDKRFGLCSYRTGASFFLLSKITGAAVRLYLVCMILQRFLFDAFHIPFALTAVIVLCLIWLYTRRSGIRTIVWTDCLQTFVLLLALVLIIVQVTRQMNLSASDAWTLVTQGPYSRVFVWDDWADRQNFFKQFLSGIFIVIVMTGLDQDMMQKNLTCRNLKEAQKNLCCYGISFVPVNFLFLALGILLVAFAGRNGILLPEAGDDVLPFLCAEGYLGRAALVCFSVGIIAAAFSSADSALTALTTSFCVDIMRRPADERLRRQAHWSIAALFLVFILLFRALNSTSVIDAIYLLASYTYGPLLGLFAFGLFTRRVPRERYVPVVAVLSPLLCLAVDRYTLLYMGYRFGYEMLMCNGMLTFIGLWLLSLPAFQKKQ